MKSAAFVIMLALGVVSGVETVSAQSLHSPLSRQCGQFRDSKQFVAETSLYCLKRNSRSCDREARRMFARCEFAGSYDDLSRRVHEGMLFAFVLASAPRLGSKLTSIERP